MAYDDSEIKILLWRRVNGEALCEHIWDLMFIFLFSVSNPNVLNFLLSMNLFKCVYKCRTDLFGGSFHGDIV